MLASKVGLVISGADHKLSITELNHSRGKKNKEQTAQAAWGGGPVGRNGRENEEMNNILVGLEAVFNCCLDLMSHNIQRITLHDEQNHTNNNELDDVKHAKEQL